MPFRKLPNTDVQRSTALQRCKTKADITLPADRPISAASFASLGAAKTAWDAAVLARTISMGGQTTSTSAANVAFGKAQQLISHFIQTLNMAIERGAFPPTARSYYELDLGQTQVPPLTSEADITLWGGRVKNGEVARIAAGGAAITFPPVAEVNVACDDFDVKRLEQGAMSGTQDEKEEAVAALREETDYLIKELWDEIEFTYRHESPSSLRGKAREWGVVYVSRPGEEDEEPATPPTSSTVIIDSVGAGTYTVILEAEGPGTIVGDVFEKVEGAPDFVQVGTDVPLGPFTRTGVPAGDVLVKLIPKNAAGTGPESDVIGLTVS